MDKKDIERIIKGADLVPSFSHIETTDKLSAEITFRLPSATKRLVRDLWDGSDSPFKGLFKSESEFLRYALAKVVQALAERSPDSLRNPALADLIKQEELAKIAARSHMTARMLETTTNLLDQLVEAVKNKDLVSGGQQLDTYIVAVNGLGTTWREAYFRALTGRSEWSMVKERLAQYSEYLGLLEE